MAIHPIEVYLFGPWQLKPNYWNLSLVQGREDRRDKWPWNGCNPTGHGMFREDYGMAVSKRYVQLGHCPRNKLLMPKVVGTTTLSLRTEWRCPDLLEYSSTRRDGIDSDQFLAACGIEKSALIEIKIGENARITE